MSTQPVTTPAACQSGSQAKSLPATRAPHIATPTSPQQTATDDPIQREIEQQEEREFGTLILADRALQMGCYPD